MRIRNFWILCFPLFLAACEDPVVAKTKELLETVRQVTAEARSLVENGNIEEASTALQETQARVEQVLAEDFNGDRCLFHDNDDGPCPFEAENPYTGKRDEGVQWNMYRANLWLRNAFSEVRHAESVGAYRAWENAVYPTAASVSRFLIADYQDPSWQDVIIFNLIIRPSIEDKERRISGNICSEVKSLADNEFERQEILEQWRRNLVDHGPLAGEGDLLRGISAVHIDDYSFDQGAFINRRELVDRGRWSFEVDGKNLIAEVDVANELARGVLSWGGVGRSCRISYDAIVEAVRERIGENVSIPERATLQIVIPDASQHIFMDVPVQVGKAKSLISRYQRIGDRMAARDRQLAAMVAYEIQPDSVKRRAAPDSISIRVNAVPRNVTFYGFSNADWDTYAGYGGMFGEEHLYAKQKVPDTDPLFSTDIAD